MNIRKILSIGIVMFIMQGAMAQHQVQLTLEEAMNLATKNNWQIRMAEENVGIATAELAQSKSVFLPRVNLSETFITTTDPLASFGIKLKQEVTSEEDFNPELLNDPARIENFTTQIKIEQPIINPEGILAKRATSIKVKSSEQEMMWVKHMTILHIKSQYFNLQLGYARQEAVSNALKAGQASQKVAKDLFDQNLINKADLMAAELSLTELESEVLSSKNYLSNLNISLLHTLGLDEESILIPIDSLPAITDMTNEIQLATIPENRTDLMALRLQSEASNAMLLSSKASLVPRLNAFGTYELNDQSVFGNGANNYLIGAKLEWDIFKGGTNVAKIQKATHQKRLSEIMLQEKISESNRELRQIKNDLKLSSKQIALSKLAHQQAIEVYQVRKDRFTQGMEKISDLLQAEAQVLMKKLKSLQRYNNYQQLVFQLEVLLEREFTNRI
jgi:outer membrane protein TolC